MYLEHFGLNTNPFAISPKLGFLYRSETFEESMAHLIYGLEQSEAIVLITGAIGTGKTMAIQSFLTNLGAGFETALVTNTRVSGRELLKLILDDLGVDVMPILDKSDLIIIFRQFLLRTEKEGRRVLVVIDEAQNLGIDVLEEIRLLTNLGQGESQPVQIVLVGQPELDATLNAPELAQLRQRIRVHYRLDPLSHREIKEYVRHRMIVGGCQDEVFTPEALDRIFALSGGVPRLVNTLANDALLCAFVEGHRKVRGADVQAEDTAPTVARAVGPPATLPSPRPSVGESTAPAGPVYVLPRRGFLAGMAVVAATSVIVLAAVWFMGFRLPDRNPVTLAASTTVSPPPAATTTESLPPAATTTESLPPAATTTESLPPAASATTVEVSEATSAVKYIVHIGSFRTEDRAATYVTKLAAHTGAAFQRYELVKGVGWHRVFIGPYERQETALAAAKVLSAEMGFDYYRLIKFESPVGN